MNRGIATVLLVVLMIFCLTIVGVCVLFLNANIRGEKMRRIFMTFLLIIIASIGNSLFAAPCKVVPIRAADTGNVIGYIVSGDKGSVVVQNQNSVVAACKSVTTDKPITQV